MRKLGLWPTVVSALFGVFVGASCGDEQPSKAHDASSECLIEGPDGFEQGELIANFTVKRCDGNDVTLRELTCGRSLILLDIGAAAFRACVDATDVYAKDPAFNELQAQGLQIVQVFLGDQRFEIPTTRFCTDYAAQHEVDFDFLIDQIGETSLFSQIHPLNLVLNGEGKILHKWEGTVPDDRIDILRALLAAQ